MHHTQVLPQHTRPALPVLVHTRQTCTQRWLPHKGHHAPTSSQWQQAQVSVAAHKTQLGFLDDPIEAEPPRNPDPALANAGALVQ